MSFSKRSWRLSICCLVLLTWAWAGRWLIQNNIYNTASVTEDDRSAYASYITSHGAQALEMINSFLYTGAATKIKADRLSLQEYDPSSVQAYCAAQEWPKDLVFECVNIKGGLCNVKQEILNCVRHAMAARAALIVPHPKPRIANNVTEGEEIVNGYTRPNTLDLLFDTDKFVDGLALICPEMVVYSQKEDVPFETRNTGPYPYTSGLSQFELDITVSEWLDEHRRENETGLLVESRNDFMVYAPCNDGPDFAEALGSLLRPREDVMRMAEAVMAGLSAQAKSVDGEDGYMGIHLRTSRDSARYKWATYETQAALYTQYVARYKPTVIYVASGNLSSVDMFAALVAPIPVVNKYALLSAQDQRLLSAMSWDLQGYVDYIVLEHSTQFLGMGDSSFSNNIAASRRSLAPLGACGLVTLAEKGIVGLHSKDWDDGLSAVVAQSGPVNVRHGRMRPPYFWP